MADASYTQTNFTGGEWSLTMSGRFDREDYTTALARCLNAYPCEEGGWLRRSGVLQLGYTRGGNRALLREFHLETGSIYNVEITAGAYRFWLNDQLVLDDNAAGVTKITPGNPPTATTAFAHGLMTFDTAVFSVADSSGTVADPQLLGRVFIVERIDDFNFFFSPAVAADTGFDGTALDLSTNHLVVSRVHVLPNSIAEEDLILHDIRVVDAGDVLFVLNGRGLPDALRTLHIGIGTDCTFDNFDVAASVFTDGPYLDPPDDDSILTPSGVTGQITLTLSYPPWNIATVYKAGDQVAYTGTYYSSRVDNNLAFTPTTSPSEWGAFTNVFAATDVGRMIRLFSGPADWDPGTSYATDDTVTYNDATYIALSGSTGKQPDVSVDVWSATAAASAWTWGRIIGYTSATVVTVQLMGGDLINANVISKYRLGLYSDTTGWPTCGCFEGGRVWFAGAQPNRVDSSKTNDIFNFAPTLPDGTVTDDSGISAIFNSAEPQKVVWMSPGQDGILCGTQGGEWLIQASNLNDPITPTSITARRPTAYGNAFVEPRHPGFARVSVQAKGQKLYEYIVDAYTGKLSGADLTLRSRHITRAGITQLAYQVQPIPLIWACMNDGSLASLIYKRESPLSSQPANLQGWAPHSFATGRQVFDISSSENPDGTQDSINLVTFDPFFSGVHFVEKMLPPWQEEDPIEEAVFLDGIRPAGAEIVTVMGLDYVRFYGMNPMSSYVGWGVGLDLGTFTASASGGIDVPLDQTGQPLTRTILANADGLFENTIAVSAHLVPNAGVPNYADLREYVPDPSVAGPYLFTAGMDVPSNVFIVPCAGGSNPKGWVTYNLSTGAETGFSADASLDVGPMVVDQDNIFYAATRQSANSGPVEKRSSLNGALIATFGSVSSALTTGTGHLAQSWGMALMKVGGVKTYIVSVSALAVSPDTTAAIDVIDADTMQWTGQSYELPSELRGDICPGAVLQLGCYSESKVYILGRNKLNSPSTDPITLYSFSGGPARFQLSTLGSTTPADVDPTWSHFSVGHGIAYDETDGNIICCMETADAVAHTIRIFKLSAQDGGVIWSTPIAAAPFFLGQNTRIAEAAFAWAAGSIDLYSLNTLTGVVTVFSTGMATVEGGMCWDGQYGVLAANVGYTPGGTIVATPNSGFSQSWARFFSVFPTAAPSPPAPKNGSQFYSVPFIFGNSYNSDGQVLRPISPDRTGARNGPALGKTRRNHQYSTLVLNAGTMEFGTDFSRMNPAHFQSPGGRRYAAGELFTGVHWLGELNDQYGFDGQICWRASGPYPATVLAVEAFLHTQDR